MLASALSAFLSGSADSHTCASSVSTNAVKDTAVQRTQTERLKVRGSERDV